MRRHFIVFLLLMSSLMSFKLCKFFFFTYIQRRFIESGTEAY